MGRVTRLIPEGGEEDQKINFPRLYEHTEPPSFQCRVSIYTPLPRTKVYILYSSLPSWKVHELHVDPCLGQPAISCVSMHLEVPSIFVS